MKKKRSGPMLTAALLLAVGLAYLVPLSNNVSTDVTYATRALAMQTFEAPDLSWLNNLLSGAENSSTPVLFFSDLIDGPKSGWEGSATKGAAVSVWGKNFGSSRGSNHVTVGGADLTDDSDYAEWGVTTNNARGLERITFWLNSNMNNEAGTITVTINGETSNTLPFYVRNTGNIYFVDHNNGNNNYNGKYASFQGGNNGPWKTLGYARQHITGGDLVYIRNGTYTEGDGGHGELLSLDYVSGSQNAYTAFVGYPAEYPLLNNTGNTRWTIRNYYDAPQYIVCAKFKSYSVMGLVAVGGGTSQFCRFVGIEHDGLDIYPTGRSMVGCLDLKNINDVKVFGCHVHNWGYDKFDHGIYAGGSGSGSILRHEYAWNEFNDFPAAANIGVSEPDVSGITIKVADSGTNYNDEYDVHNNLCYNMYHAGIFVYLRIKNIRIWNNIVYNCGQHGGRSAVGIYNLSYPAGSGMVYFYNNVVYGSAQGSLLLIDANSYLTMKNNIFYSLSSTPYVNGSNTHTTSDYDLYYGNGSAPAWATNTLNSDPQFYNPANYDFHLQESSPAKDAGTSAVDAIVTRDYDGVARPQSTGYDRGAYEYVSTVPDTTPVLFFSDMTDGPTSGWEGSATKGAAVSVWGINLGSSRGTSTVTVGGVTLDQDSDYAEWGATTNPTTARGLERITFYLNSSMPTGVTTISVATSEGVSNSLSFYCRAIGSNHIYFISRSGNDSNSGLYATQGSGSNGPWKLANKVRTLQAGDVCYFRTGIWNEIDASNRVINFLNTNHGNGTVNNSISIASYPGEAAQLGDNSVSNVIGHHGSSGDVLNYWTFSKFTMRSNSNTTSWGAGGLGTGSDDHIRLIGNDVQTTYGGSSALHLCGQAGSTYFYIYGNYVHDCGVDARGQTSPDRAYPLYLAGYGNQNHIYVGWNEFAYNQNGRGLQVFGHLATDSIDNLYIHNNWIHNNGLTGAILGAGDPGTTEYKFVRNVWFYNNIVANNGLRVAEGSYPGVLCSSKEGGNWYLYNNVFYHNRGGEISINNAGTIPIESVVVKNNIINPYTGEAYYNGSSGTWLTGSNNCYYGAGDGPSWDIDKIVGLDPQFVSPDPQSFEDFYLKGTSPAVDNGTSTVSSLVSHDFYNIPRPQGSGYDIGAYEYMSTELNIATSTLPNATIGVSYSATLSAAGGTPPYTWQTISGSLPNGLSLNSSTGNISGTPTTAGTSNFTVQVTDAGLNTATKGFTIIVSALNNPPVLAPIGNKTVDEGQLLQFTISATDPDGDNLTYLAINLPTGANFIGQTFSWTPTYSQAGSYNVTFSVDDGKGGNDSESITITVNNVNRPPVLNPIDNITVNEGGTVTITPSANDPDGDNLSYTYSGWMTSSTYTTTYDDAGVHTVTVTVSDGSLTDSENVTVTVNNVNRPPVLGAIGDKSVAEGATLTFGVTASDPDNDPVTITAAPLESWMGFNGTTFTANPGTGDTGNYLVTFTASDGSLTDNETITISVGDVNRPPVLGAIGDKTVTVGTLLTFTVSATDPDDDPLAYSATGLPTGATFTAQTFSWTPTSSQAGSYGVTFSVADDNGGTDSEDITVTVTGADVTPPATVSDLSAFTGANEGEINLRWTAPGDDGGVGTATTYIVRYSSSPIDTDTKFDGAIDMTGEPTPSAAGTTESMTVSGLTPGGTYYFAIRAQDEVPNISGLSNSPSAEAKGPTAPSYTIVVGFGDAVVTVLEIKLLREVESPRITLQESADRPAETTTAALGTIYRYLKITKENIDDNDISSVTTTFKVERSWIEGEKIDKLTLESYSSEDGQWASLPTTRVREDDNYVYYSAASSGLPIFAITGEAPASGEGGTETLLVLGVSVMVILAIVFALYRFRFKKSYPWRKL